MFIEKFKLHTSCKTSLFSENCADYEITCNNNLYPDTSQMKLWNICIAYWPTKAYKFTQNCDIYLFPLQQLLFNVKLYLHCVSLFFYLL